jgi:hypothetical protein
MRDGRICKIKGIMDCRWQGALDKSEDGRVGVYYHRWKGGFCDRWCGGWGIGCTGDKVCCTDWTKSVKDVFGGGEGRGGGQ